MRTLSYIITCTSCIHVHVYTSCYRHVYMLEETTTSLSKEGNLEQSIIWNENISCKQTFLGEEKNNKYLWLMRLLLAYMYMSRLGIQVSLAIICLFIWTVVGWVTLPFFSFLFL